MKHQEVRRLDLKGAPALFLSSSLCFGIAWFSVLVYTMRLNEEQSHTTMVFSRAFFCILGFGCCLPLAVVVGVACFAYCFRRPAIIRDWLYGSEAATEDAAEDDADESEESVLRIMLTAWASGICLMLVSILWIRLNDICGEFLKQPKLLFVIVLSYIALYSLLFTTTLAAAVSFALCSIEDICKKYSRTAKVSPISDIESLEPKPGESDLETPLVN